MKYIKNTPMDYTDNRHWVYFELGGVRPDKRHIDTPWVLDKIDFIEPQDIKEVEYGFNLHVCIQHTPEVVRIFEQENIGIYQIVRLD